MASAEEIENIKLFKLGLEELRDENMRLVKAYVKQFCNKVEAFVNLEKPTWESLNSGFISSLVDEGSKYYHEGEMKMDVSYDGKGAIVFDVNIELIDIDIEYVLEIIAGLREMKPKIIDFDHKFNILHLRFSN
jgi:hypothetical protein